MNLKYSEFLIELSSYVTYQEPYICCHLEGMYLESCWEPKTEEYVELITSPEYKKHHTRLKTTITSKINNYNKLHGVNNNTLTAPLKEQFLNRVQWLQYLAEIAESEGN